MQGGQGRGGARTGYAAGGGGGRGPGVTYGTAPGYFYNDWGVYNAYHMQPVMPMPPMPPMPRPMYGGRGVSPRPFVPLGVQGAGILKRPSGVQQGGFSHGGRGYRGGYGGRPWGGRGRKNITKEDLDADLDQWRMKDKKFGGQSLDADLDEYWKKKEEDSEQQDGETKEPEDDAAEGSKSTTKDPLKEVKGKSPSGHTIVRHSNGEDNHPEDTTTEVSPKGG